MLPSSRCSIARLVLAQSAFRGVSPFSIPGRPLNPRLFSFARTNPKSKSEKNEAEKGSPSRDPIDIMVIGSMAVNITCTIPGLTRGSLPLHTSYASKMHATAGGVAHNVALAASYASPGSVQLITAVGADPEGGWLTHYLQRAELDVKLISGTGETARNIKINDKSGGLILSTADMSIIETFEQDDLQAELHHGNPKCVVFDGYIAPEAVQTILEGCEPTTKVLFEPTSEERATIIFEKPVELGIFPNHSLNMTTPNVYELRAMFKAAQKNGHFDGSEWRSVLDSFMLTSQFRQDVEFVLRKASRLHRLGSLEDPAEIEYSAPGAERLDLNLGRDLMGEGALQQAVALLPFIPNIFIKLGSLGVFCVRLVHKDAVIKDTDASTLRFPGLNADVVVQHHRGLPHQGIVSLTGGGDTFSGVLIAKLAGGSSVSESVDTAQKACIMTIASADAVSQQIRELKV